MNSADLGLIIGLLTLFMFGLFLLTNMNIEAAVDKIIAAIKAEKLENKEKEKG